MLGRSIDDDVESGAGTVDGLGLLRATTTFEVGKITRPRQGTALGCAVAGYQIHHGRTTSEMPWVALDDHWGSHRDGAADADTGIWGTSLHGLFESNDFRGAFL